MVDLNPEVYMTGPYLVFDLETTNLDKGFAGNKLNDVVSAAWYCNRDCTGKVHYQRGGIFDQRALLASIEQVLANGGFLVAHNAKFDIQWLSRMGIDLHKVLVYDTMIGDYVLAGNRKYQGGLALGGMAPRYGMEEGKAPFVDALMKGGTCPSEMPHDYLRARAIRDVKQTTRIFRQQRKRLKEEGKLPVMFTRCIFTPVLADIEMQGIALDQQRTMEEYSTAQMEYGIARAEFTQLFGDINPRSIPQMAKLIYGTLGFEEPRDFRGRPQRNKASKAFPDGAPKCDNKTLDKLGAKTHEQREFLRLRKEIGKTDAALTKTLEFFKGTLDEYGGIFYGSFNQTVTATHRLSSTSRRKYFEQYGTMKGAQLQNMPGRYKDLIRPKKEGYLIADADGSQLEFRVAAFLGQDTKAIYNIRHDVDQHKFTAMALNDLSEAGWDALTKAQQKAIRSAAKPDTFKPLYGGTRGTPDQERYYAAFREEFAELSAVQESWTFRVLDRKKLDMPWGMTFHFPYTKQDQRTGYISNTPSIYNYPVQNLATAEIIPIALTYLWYRAYRNDPRIKLINTVHDSGTAEIPKGTEALWTALSAQCFSMDVYHYLAKVYNLDFNVPLGVGVSIGERWESPDATEWEANVEQSGEYWMKGDRA
jgi:DNA polymerase I-like protein with 3'-5' exonuclease and polymerase domains